MPFKILFTSGCAYFLALHLLGLSRTPGLHYDEAWAANFAHRIASEPGFWPYEAMSPYTAAWGHYFSAFFFKLFGTSLWVFRLSGVLLSFLGVLGLSFALARFRKKEAAALLPWACATSVPLVLNHRFVIDVTTFHAFCLGLLAVGLSLRLTDPTRPKLGMALASLAVFLGTTSHVLFLAPALGALAAAYLMRKELSWKDRRWVLVLSLVLGASFVPIYLKIPEKDKALGLLVLSGATLVLSLLKKSPFSGRARKPVWILVGLLSLVPLLYVTLFLEGHWGILFTFGGLQNPLWVGSFFLPAAVWIGLCVKNRRKLPVSDPVFRDLGSWLILTAIASAILITKPTLRYFETTLLLIETCFCVVLAQAFSRKQAWLVLALFLVQSQLVLQANYFGPGSRFAARERDVRFLFFRDNSRDSLPEQYLAQRLGSLGCRPDQVVSSDPRLMESIRFLGHGDWGQPLSKESPCPYRKVHVERVAGRALQTRNDLTVVGDFVMIGIPETNPGNQP